MFHEIRKFCKRDYPRHLSIWVWRPINQQPSKYISDSSINGRTWCTVQESSNNVEYWTDPYTNFVTS